MIDFGDVEIEMMFKRACVSWRAQAVFYEGKKYVNLPLNEWAEQLSDGSRDHWKTAITKGGCNDTKSS